MLQERPANVFNTCTRCPPAPRSGVHSPRWRKLGRLASETRSLASTAPPQLAPAPNCVRDRSAVFRERQPSLTLLPTNRLARSLLHRRRTRNCAAPANPPERWRDRQRPSPSALSAASSGNAFAGLRCAAERCRVPPPTVAPGLSRTGPATASPLQSVPDRFAHNAPRSSLLSAPLAIAAPDRVKARHRALPKNSARHRLAG